MDIKEKKTKSIKQERSVSIFGNRLRKKSIPVFTRQFASMLKAGIPLMTILDVLTSEEKNKRMITILDSVRSQVMKGDSLSSALSSFSEFPKILTTMITVGEANGKLDEIFDQVSSILEKELKLVSKIKGAMIYPCLLLIVSILSSILLTFIVIPVFVNMFSQFGVELPLFTRIFISISNYLRDYWYYCIAFILFIIFIFIKLAGIPSVRIIIDKLVFVLPVVGRIGKTVLMSRFCRTFSSLVDSGVGMLKSIDTVKNLFGNTYIKSKFAEIRQNIQNGTSFFTATNASGVFTTLVERMIKVGEESGNLGEVLAHTAQIYDDETDAYLQKITAMVEPVVTAVIALVIGFIVLSVVQPMFQLYASFSK